MHSVSSPSSLPRSAGSSSIASRRSMLRSLVSLLDSCLMVDDTRMEQSADSASHSSLLHLSHSSGTNALADTVRLRGASHFPSMSLFGDGRSSMNQESSATTAVGNSNTRAAEEFALHNLDKPLCYNGCDLPSVPAEMTQRASSSFVSLVEANLRQFFKRQLLRGQMRKRDRATSRTVEGDMNDRAEKIASSFFRRGILDLANDPVIYFQSFETYCSLAEGDSHHCAQSETEIAECVPSLTLPVSFHLRVRAKVRGKPLMLDVTAQGTFVGHFSNEGEDEMIDHVDLTLNPQELLSSLRQKARVLVLAAVTSGSTKAAEKKRSFAGFSDGTDPNFLRPVKRVIPKVVPSMLDSGLLPPERLKLPLLNEESSSRMKIVTPPSSPKRSTALRDYGSFKSSVLGGKVWDVGSDKLMTSLAIPGSTRDVMMNSSSRQENTALLKAVIGAIMNKNDGKSSK